MTTLFTETHLTPKLLLLMVLFAAHFAAAEIVESFL